MTSKITLYHDPISAPSRIAVLVVRYLNLDVDIKYVNLLKKEQFNEEFLKINPQHTVPTIDDNGFHLWESRAIAQYLVELKAPNSTLIPKDVKERATMYQRLYFDLGTLLVRHRAIFHPILHNIEKTVPEDKKQQFHEALKLLDGFLEGHDWFVGNTITLADLSILGTLSSSVHSGVDISKYKNLSAWYKRCREIPGFEENEKGAEQFGALIQSKAKLTI